MKIKHVIIGLCVLIVLYILYKNKNQQHNTQNSSENNTTKIRTLGQTNVEFKLDKNTIEQTEKKTTDNINLKNNEERNKIVTKTDEWFKQTCKRIFELSHGTTSDEQREEIVDLISECQTDAEINKLINTYGRDADEDSLPDVINWEMKLNGKARPMFTRLNENLKNNGCTYQFKLW